MLETIDKSKAARRWAWALVLSPPCFALAWKAADIVTAVHTALK